MLKQFILNTATKFMAASLIILLTLAFSALGVTPAPAAGTVSICDESHLDSALAGGGTVTFSCSGTITLTSTIEISSDIMLDGTGQSVAISGNGAAGVFIVHKA